jgi:hypothetical protein
MEPSAAAYVPTVAPTRTISPPPGSEPKATIGKQGMKLTKKKRDVGKAMAEEDGIEQVGRCALGDFFSSRNGFIIKFAWCRQVIISVCCGPAVSFQNDIYTVEPVFWDLGEL